MGYVTASGDKKFIFLVFLLGPIGGVSWASTDQSYSESAARNSEKAGSDAHSPTPAHGEISARAERECLLRKCNPLCQTW